MTRWLVLFSFFLAACSNSVPPDTKWADADSGSTDSAGVDDGGDSDDGTDQDSMATPDEVDDDMDGFAEVDGDCDDTDATVYPGAAEQPADGIDQNCDDSEVCFADADDDGVLPEGTPTLVSSDGDCNDANEGTSDDPVGDCDDSDATVGLPGTWYSDIDEDGLGDPEESTEACEQPDGYVDNDIDPCVVVDGYAGGVGTEDDPYIVCDATTLQRLNLDLAAHYAQTTDIDLTDIAFTPLVNIDGSSTSDEESDDGAVELVFEGVYNGNDHSIIGLSIDETDAAPDSNTPTALFRHVGTQGVIQNLRFEGVDIQSRNGAATVAGTLTGVIKDVQVGGVINISGNFNVGGIAGFMLVADATSPPEISNVHVGTGNLTNKGLGEGAPAYLSAGGLLGGAFGGRIENASSAIHVTWDRTDASMSISVSNSTAAGGAVGRAVLLTLSDVHTTGDVEGIHAVGGVFGSITNEMDEACTLSNLTSSGEIVGVGGGIGGVAGELAGDACHLGSTGSIHGAYWVGGVAGINEAVANCDQCFSSAEVTGIDGPFSVSAGIGGLWGYSSASGSITNSIFSGELSWLAGGETYAGGLIGMSSFVDAADLLAFENNVMIGNVSLEEGGLIIGTALGRSTDALDGAYFQNNVYIDHQAERLPNTAHGTRSLSYDVYWGDELTEDEFRDLDDTSETLDFDTVWAMASTTDASSPLYGMSHPVLTWQCEYDLSIICDTLD